MLVLLGGCQPDELELRSSELTALPAALQGLTVADAEPCQWPTAVVLDQGGCSGVLIHPQVVMTAGHCIGDGSGPTEVRFGEHATEPAKIVATSSCARHPEADGSVTKHDYAYCVLAEPVDMAIVPPLLGCELDLLEVGQSFVTVGWGHNGRGLGTKRMSTSEFLGWYEGMLGASAGSNEACKGDSGGPTYMRLPDGSWRVLGVSSGGPAGDIPECIDPLLIVPAAETIAWIEEQSGIDISPCHLADGTWAPGPACTGFALDPVPATGYNPWVDGSCVDERTGPISTCGPSFEQSEESDPPTADLVMPVDGTHYSNAPARFDVVVDADDGDGVAVLSVALRVDGEVVASESIASPIDQPPSWVLAELELAEGTHELDAIATDYWGNVGVSEPVTIIVGDGDAPDGGAPDGPAGEAGCTCTAGQPRAGLTELGMLVLLMVLGSGRRARTENSKRAM